MGDAVGSKMCGRSPKPVSSVQVPVPVFVPTTLQGAEQIIESINELKSKVSSDLLSVAKTATEDQKPGTLMSEPV